MSLVEEVFGEIIFDFLWNTIRRIGALVRWPFLYSKLSIDEIYNQKWSGIVGLIFLSVIITLSVLLFL